MPQASETRALANKTALISEIGLLSLNGLELELKQARAYDTKAIAVDRSGQSYCVLVGIFELRIAPLSA